MAKTLEQMRTELDRLQAKKRTLDERAAQYLMRANDLEEGRICKLRSAIARAEGR